MSSRLAERASMIRRNFKRLAAQVDPARFAAKPDHRAFIRLAYELGGHGEPDEDGFRRHEAELDRGLSHVELIRAVAGETLTRSAQEVASMEPVLSARVLPEDADSLICLAFKSLLRRDADAETYAAYRGAFEQGTTFRDLINDVVQSEEFKIVDERIEHLFAASNHPQTSSPSPEHPIVSDMGGALTLLETRLREKGCEIQLGVVPVGAIDASSAHARMRSLMLTLSFVEKL